MFPDVEKSLELKLTRFGRVCLLKLTLFDASSALSPHHHHFIASRMPISRRQHLGFLSRERLIGLHKIANDIDAPSTRKLNGS